MSLGDQKNAGMGTKERILVATEQLIAEHGFESVSLRDITGVADVNIAAVNYHFGSKEALFEAIQCRYMAPVNNQRITRLAALTVNGRVPSVREILEAFMRPFLVTVKGSDMNERLFFKLMGRCISDGQASLPEALIPEFKVVAERYTAALSLALPEVDLGKLLWRLHFTFGVMAQTLLHGDLLVTLTEGKCEEPDVEAQFQHMIDFCVAGFLTEKGGEE